MHTRRPGFTLIELLVVVVIIGVLASIAVPKFSNTKGRAHLSAMRSDLKNIATAQEAFMYDNSRYASEAELGFSFSPGVHSAPATSITGNALGWSAKVTHDQAFPRTCALFFGPTPLAPATTEGVVACD